MSDDTPETAEDAGLCDLTVLDLDGPLLQTAARHDACHQIAAEAAGVEPEPDHFARKRANTSTVSDALEAKGASARRAYRTAWLQYIESPALLELDSVHPRAHQAVRRLRERSERVIICTLRQSPTRVLAQVHHLELADLVDDLLVVPHAQGAAGKARAVMEVGESTARLRWIGDTEVDAAAARALGAELWLVTCGIRSAQQLARLHPDRLAPDLATLVGLGSPLR